MQERVVLSVCGETRWRRGRRPPLSKLEIENLDYLHRHGRATNRELQETLGVTKTQAQWILKKLKDKKRLQVHGAGRAMSYTA